MSDRIFSLGIAMAAWRRRALELFPQLRAELQQPDYSIYMLFFDLLPTVREAHDADRKSVV